jgi:hypothetical protein
MYLYIWAMRDIRGELLSSKDALERFADRADLGGYELVAHGRASEPLK